MKPLKTLLSLLVILYSSGALISQSDSLVFSGNNIIVGEIKELKRGIIVIETDYSDSDFQIEWNKVLEIYSDETYTMSLKDRTILTGAKINTASPGRLLVQHDEGEREVAVTEIVYFRQLDDSFLSRLSANVDIGYSLAKANNLSQYNARAAVGYKTPRWVIGSTYDQVRSTQDDVDPIRRTDVTLSADYQLLNGVFFGASLNWLSNTEQRLDLRTTGGLGAGYYFFRTTTFYWNGFLGVAINNETFDNTGLDDTTDPLPTPARESYEGIIGTELNLYDIGDLNLFTNAYWYPSFTESGRNRFNLRFDLKYDLPLDFYIKTGLTYNFDSQPAEGASTDDYVWQTGFGWEL